MLVKTGPFHEAEVPPAGVVFFQHVRAGDVRGHQVGRELDTLEVQIQNARQRADHQRFGQAGHAFQQAMSTRKDGGEDLFDHFILTDDDLLQFFLHHFAMLAELLKHLSQIALFGRHERPIPLSSNKVRDSVNDSLAMTYGQTDRFVPKGVRCARLREKSTLGKSCLG